jgi:hypothetical protein
MNAEGYAVAEEAFHNEEDDPTTTLQFNSKNPDHMAFADVNIGRNLQHMLKLIKLKEGEAAYVQEYLVEPYYYSGGLDDFLYETLPQCLSCRWLIQAGVMETYYDTSAIKRLLVHFFAKLKLVYGSLSSGECPEISLTEGYLFDLEVDESRFSFRELTLLSGYKTERAVRNLASPSTPDHKRINVVKDGRKTFVEHDEAVRWLKQNKKL